MSAFPAGTKMMRAPAVKTETAIACPNNAASVLPLGLSKRKQASPWLATRARAVAASVIPPLVVIALALIIWEILCRRAGAALPPPSRVLEETWELIVDPFFDRGGIDRGLFWHISASLQRVA